MKYSEVIEKIFSDFSLTPRPGQLEAIDKILVEFVDEKMKNVILCAPTGTGKSIIGMITAEAVSRIKNPAEKIKSSIMLCSTNVLSKQYETSFTPILKDKFIQIKGASNYDCSALSTPENPENAEACAWYTMVQSGSEFDSTLHNHCNKCDYLAIKKKKNLTRHLTTNYSYFFIDRMYTGKFENRDLIIWDEAHLINDLFSEHNAIYFSQSRMKKIQEEIAENVRLTDLEISKIITSLIRDCGTKGKINETNYEAYLRALMDVYTYAKQEGQAQAERALRSGNMGQYSKLSRFTKKFEGLYCKIDDLFKYDYPHVFEYKEEDKAVSVKPVFVGQMMDALRAGDHNLFMSATVSSDFMTKTLELEATKTKFIKLEPTFPKENKEVVFFDTLSLSYTSLQDPATVKALRKNVAKVVKFHIDDGDRGIILTPSFKLQGELIAELQAQSWLKNYKLFEHRQGEKLENTLTAFKAYKNGPALLVSPSLFEGIDLPGDLSRFQILVKAPYPSLGDKRIKFILDKHPDIYNTITCMKMVQGAGRSVRSAEDHATTYVLDKNGERLFGSATNIWRNEFNLRYTKFL